MRVNLFGEIVEEAATRKQLFKPIHDSPGAKIRVVPSSIRSEQSLVTQSNHWVDFRGAARGNVTRQQRCPNEEQCHSAESQRIGGSDAKEKRLHVACLCQRAGYYICDTNDYLEHSLAQ